LVEQAPGNENTIRCCPNPSCPVFEGAGCYDADEDIDIA